MGLMMILPLAVDGTMGICLDLRKFRHIKQRKKERKKERLYHDRECDIKGKVGDCILFLKLLLTDCLPASLNNMP